MTGIQPRFWRSASVTRICLALPSMVGGSRSGGAAIAACWAAASLSFYRQWLRLQCRRRAVDASALPDTGLGCLITTDCLSSDRLLRRDFGRAKTMQWTAAIFQRRGEQVKSRRSGPSPWLGTIARPRAGAIFRLDIGGGSGPRRSDRTGRSRAGSPAGHRPCSSSVAHGTK